jgi:hypothetical protein
MRYLFGFEGQMLVDGATSANCQRCTAEEIEDYLDHLGATLDIDGNGQQHSLTDGLLLLRFLLGFTDPVLTANGVAANCTRCDGPAVIDYLTPLTAD